MRKLFLTMALAAAFVAPAYAAKYTVTVLPGYAASLNEAGHIAVTAGGVAGLFDGTHTTSFGTLGGTSSSAMDINNLDQVVGYSATAGWPGHQHAFLSSGNAMVDLGTLGGKTSTARAINDSGVVVGSADLAGAGVSHAFAYTQAGGMKDLGTLGGKLSAAFDVNARGDIIGYADTATSQSHAFLYSNGVMTDIDAQFGLGSQSDGWLTTTSFMTHLRFANNGAIIGDIQSILSDPDGMVYDYWYQAAIYDKGVLTKLNAPLIGDVNAAGAMLTNNDYRGGSLTVGGVETGLYRLAADRPDLDLWGAFHLNGEGQILAYGEDSSHHQIDVLLTPVPEPETWAMLLGGLALLGWTKRRQRQSA